RRSRRSGPSSPIASRSPVAGPPPRTPCACSVPCAITAVTPNRSAPSRSRPVPSPIRPKTEAKFACPTSGREGGSNHCNLSRLGTRAPVKFGRSRNWILAMVRGRKPKPTNLKIVQGNPGKRPLNQAEPQPGVLEDLTPPTGLDAYGRDAWKRNAPVLARLGLLTEADRDALAAYCMAYSRWRRANIALRKVKPDDESYRAIAVTVEKAEQSMRLLAGEFGMTPSSRSRLQVAPSDVAVDPMEE